MTWSIRWWDGDSWEAIPAAALAGTYAGGSEVVYPPASELGLDGAPCGAVGRPEIHIASAWMTGAGLDWWLDRLKTLGVPLEAVACDIEMYDRRYGQTQTYHGYLLQPQAKAHMGASVAYTTFTDVLIRIVNCTASSH